MSILRILMELLVFIAALFVWFNTKEVLSIPYICAAGLMGAIVADAFMSALFGKRVKVPKVSKTPGKGFSLPSLPSFGGDSVEKARMALLLNEARARDKNVEQERRLDRATREAVKKDVKTAQLAWMSRQGASA